MKYKELICQMTIDEKVSLLSGKDFWRTNAVERLDVPSMCLSDGPHGLRKQEENGDHLGLVQGVKATCFPTSATIANSWDESLGEEIGKRLGAESVFHDVNILLGPGLNVKRNPLCGRNFEYFSEDPYLAGKMAASYIRGIQSKGISACPKHFVLNNQELLRMTSDSVADERTLRELYLTAFEITVKESHPKAIMSSYNKVNGTYANENKKLLRDVLVDEWGFEGIVVSDWGGSNDHVEGVRNGSHLEMPTTGGDSAYILKKAIQEGCIDEAIVDERVDEYLNVLFETKIEKKEKVDYEEHHAFAKKASEESIVLLKNEGILPLEKKQKVALIGDFAKSPRYQGAGSSLVNAYQLDDALSLIEKTDLDFIGFEEGYDRVGTLNSTKMKEALALAQKADVILYYVGLNEVMEVEGCDRDTMKIAKNQVDLLESMAKLSKPIVTVVSAGSAIEMPWEKYCTAIVHGYLCGEAGAGAILDVITGKVNPSGKLSESYPYKYEDVGNVNYYPGRESTSEYREAFYVGYRYFDKAGVSVQYPFGYGLSYTSFEYSDLLVNEDGVRFTVKNTGNREGKEVAQLYIGKKSKALPRPEKELKGFAKVHLMPGEEKTVTLAFDEFSFRYFNTETSSFETEAGDYQILVGASSQDIRLTTTIKKEGIEAKTSKNLSQKYFTGEITSISDQEFEGLLQRPVPPSKWDRKSLLTVNSAMAQMVYAKSFMARRIIGLLGYLRERSVKKGKPDLNLLFLYNMPFRGIAKMTAGAVTMDMAEAIVVIVNGQFFKGCNALFKAWRKSKKR